MPKHAFSAVSVHIDRLTSEQYEENDVGGVVDLIEVIRIQSSGPTEAARALRKKLKYGNVHRQIRALVILDALIQNAGPRFQKAFADEPLLERLRILARDDYGDAEVRGKAMVLFREWAVAYKGTPGLERIAALHKELPRTKRPQPQQSRIVRQQDAEAAREHQDQSPPSPQARRPEAHHASSSTNRAVAPGPSTPFPSSSIFRRDKKDKKGRNKTFNLEKEKGQLLETIASANVASTNLLNGLQLINREQQRVSENAEVLQRFETCKQLRRQILRYIHLVSWPLKLWIRASTTIATVTTRILACHTLLPPPWLLWRVTSRLRRSHPGQPAFQCLLFLLLASSRPSQKASLRRMTTILLAIRMLLERLWQRKRSRLGGMFET